MKIKKLHRICDVKGCSNRNTYSIAKKYGTGMTVIMCRECLEEALTEIDKLEGTKPEAVRTSETEYADETPSKADTEPVKKVSEKKSASVK